MMKKLNELIQRTTSGENLQILFQELNQLLEKTNQADYLKDFYTPTQAMEAIQEIQCKPLQVKLENELKKIKEDEILFQEINLHYTKVDVQRFLDLLNEIRENAEEQPEKPAPTTPEPKQPAKKEKKPVKKQPTKKSKPTHRNTTNTATESIEDKVEKVKVQIINTFKAIDKKQLMDFGNYSFICTKELFESADPLIICSKNTGAGVSFRAFINTPKIEKITHKMIKKLATDVYEDIKETLKQETRKKEIEKKRAELQAAGMRWTLDTVKEIMKELDQITGLNGANIKMKLSSAKRKKAHYRYYRNGEPVEFAFAKNLLTYATWEEFKDVVIHEYCHYWQHQLEGKSGHNKTFKALCQKLGGSGETYFPGFSQLGGAQE